LIKIKKTEVRIVDMKKRNVLLMLILITALIANYGCNGKQSEEQKTEDVFDILISYFENHNDFINSKEAPAAVNAAEVYMKLNSNIHIIDVRTPEEYAQGRVPGAVNVELPDILDYFENRIAPSSYDSIFLFSKDHQESMIANAALRLLGYNNVFNVRWGMASWNSQFAQVWENAISSKFSNTLTTEPFPKAHSGAYPTITSAYHKPYDILRERVQMLLHTPYQQFFVTASHVLENPDQYYLINYWKEEEYNIGHLPGAVHYEPKKSLTRETALSTLPVNKTIVFYCYSNSTTPILTAYLYLLGYDVKNISYGTNSFMYDVLKERIGKSFFSGNVVNEYPVEKEGVFSRRLEDIKVFRPQEGC
jgi:rhodanese-related sulfurtransferase